MPETFGFVHTIFGRSKDGSILRSARDLYEWGKKNNKFQFVLKHIGGGGGKYVIITEDIKLVDGEPEFINTAGTVYTAAEIDVLLQKEFAGLQGFLLEERLELHPEISKIAAGGLSSVRMYSLTDHQGEPHIKFGYLRIGAKDQPTDHIFNGGFVVPIHLESGKMKKAMIREGNSVEWRSAHPETEVSIEEKLVPQWQAVLDLCRQAARCSPDLRWVGWDIVLTPSGPVLLEGNVGNTISNLQMMFGGFIENGLLREWQHNLGIEKPDGSLSWRIRHSKGKTRLITNKKRLREFISF